MTATPNVLTPEELVGWCQRSLPDDTRPFEELVTLYKGRVFATAYRIMGNYQEAEDLSQEVFLKVYAGIKDLDEPASLTSWIYRITGNTCMDALRKRKRRPTTVSLLVHQDNETNGEELGVIDTQSPQPEEAALRHELQWCLEETLRTLEPAQRTMIVLRDIEDRTYDEIATTLALGLSAVKMRIHRARLLFRDVLRRVCPDAM